MPDIIPLDGPPPREAAAPPRPPQAPATLTPPPAPSAQPAAPAAVAEAAPAGRFPWPVRGRILASYGSAAGGAHNDGINIAAPLGTPVRSIDSGTVAYAGNEVKGYGNIVLIKHANGWISAYAHLDDVTVKPGDTIAAGQVIAKVGSSGGVAQPQLHFELRRGKKPVNPTEFLAPSPSAAAPTGNTAG
jgi:murein DD-endopeptidase MepM/ murein hydrolase activator NlpD